MDKEDLNKLLIVKFPFQSAWGGEEEIHLLLAQKLQNVGLITSCPHLFQAFKKNGFYAKKFWFRGTDPVSIKSVLFFFPFTGLALFITGFFWLFFFKIKGYRQVLFLRFQEKILWTPIAKLYGYKVFWGEHVGFGRWMHKNPFLFLYKFWAKFTTFIVPSNEMKNQVLAILKSKKVDVKILTNALSKEKDLSKQTKSKNNLVLFLNDKFKNHFSQKDLFIGFAGRLSREKGLLFLVDIAEKVIQKNSNCKFIIAGKGDMQNQIEQKIAEKKLENSVFLLGFLDKEKLSKFYLGIDIFCLFSDYETFGISLLDAMSASLPIVATNLGAIPEVVKNNKNGFTMRKNDIEEAIQKLFELIKNEELRNNFGSKGKEIFLKNYTEDIFAKHARDIFNQ